MAKAKQSRSESSNEDLLERIQQLEARLATVESGLEAEAALFAVSPPRPVPALGAQESLGGAFVGTAQSSPGGGESPLNGFAVGREGGSSAAGTTLAPAAAPPAPRGPGGRSADTGGEAMPRFGVNRGDEYADDDADEAEGVDPEAVSDAAARRKQPDSPIPFTPGDLDHASESRVG